MSAIPQTMTTMEAGFTVNQADAEEFWRHQERMGPVAAAAPGFLAVRQPHEQWQMDQLIV